MIQESINNLIFSTGINARLLPSYQRRMEAQDILGKARSAQAGISDLQRTLSDESKSFSETEYNDMRRRLSSLNRDFYTAKIRSHTGDPLEKYLRKGVDELMDQKELSPIIKDIELKLAKGRAGNPPDVVQGIPDETEPLMLNPGVAHVLDSEEKLKLPAGEEKLALNPGQQPLLLNPGLEGYNEYTELKKAFNDELKDKFLKKEDGNRLQDSFEETALKQRNPLMLGPGKGMMDGYVASPKEVAMDSFETKGLNALDQKGKFMKDLQELKTKPRKVKVNGKYRPVLDDNGDIKGGN